MSIMESLRLGFSEFLDQKNPEPILSKGNDLTDNLSQIPKTDFQKLAFGHIKVLLNYLFVSNENVSTANPFFACELLTHITTFYSENFFLCESLKKILKNLNSLDPNHTTLGYVYSILKPVILKKNMILCEFFRIKENIRILIRLLSSLSIAALIIDLLCAFPDCSDKILNTLIEEVKESDTKVLFNCFNVLSEAIKNLDLNVISRVFNHKVLLTLVYEQKINFQFRLRLFHEIIKLHRSNLAKQAAVGIVSDQISYFSESFTQHSKEIKILLIKIVTAAIKSNLGVVLCTIGNSEFIKLSIVLFTQEEFFDNH